MRRHASSAARPRPSNAMARVAVRLLAVRLPPPCWLRLRRGGCGVSMRVGARMPRCLTRRSCLKGAAKQRSEFCGAPRNRTDAGCPAAKRRGRRLGVAFSLVTFFWRRKREVTRMPGDSRPPPTAQACGQFREHASAPRFRQAQPERSGANAPGLRRAQPEQLEWCPGFDKLSPNGWGGWHSDFVRLSHPPPHAKSPPRATPQTAQAQSTRPPRSR